MLHRRHLPAPDCGALEDCLVGLDEAVAFEELDTLIEISTGLCWIGGPSCSMTRKPASVLNAMSWSEFKGGGGAGRAAP
jgi:hypothetical protein